MTTPPMRRTSASTTEDDTVRPSPATTTVGTTAITAPTMRSATDGTERTTRPATCGTAASRSPVTTMVAPDTGRPKRCAYGPGVVVLDGGPPQVAAAQRALDELGIDDIPVCGLAKRLEEVWLPEREDPVILARSSEALYLLQRVRDEAHRFAITHHRSRRSKSMVESLLDDVPGLGEVRRNTLLKHFGSLRKLRAATVAEIALVPGIGERTAIAIKAAVEQSSGKTVSVNTATGEIDES